MSSMVTTVREPQRRQVETVESGMGQYCVHFFAKCLRIQL